MEQITRGQIVRVGVDLAKRVIQVHGVDGDGRTVVAKARSCATALNSATRSSSRTDGAIPLTIRGARTWPSLI